MLVFVKNIWGIIVSPYETMQGLADAENIGPATALILVIVVMLAGSTFAVFSVSGKDYPFSLMAAAVGLTAALVTYMLAVAAIFTVGRIVGSRSSWRAVGATWGFTYIPTAAWFALMTLTHIVFTVPGSEGQLIVRLPDWANVVFVALSVTILLWKILLYLIVLRVSLKLSFLRVILASGLLFVLTVIYSSAVFMLGISKIPFI